MNGKTRASRRGGRKLLLGAVVALLGCQAAEPPTDALRFSAIPDQAHERVLEQHLPLMEHVCATLRKKCRWVRAQTYESVVDMLGSGEVDVAYLGAATFAQAEQRHGAVPLAMRDIDFTFTSVIVVRKESPASRLHDLNLASFSFGNRTSTSGHLMLRRRLAGENVVPERFFGSVVYATDHDDAIEAVARGRVDAAGVNGTVFYRRLADRAATATSLKVVWQSLPYTDYLWAARAGLSATTRQQLIDALLDLDSADASARHVLRSEGASGFVPAYREDFDEVRAALREQGNP